MRIVTLALLALFALPVGATGPGQPMDCADFILAPGLSAQTISISSLALSSRGSLASADGGYLRWVNRPLPVESVVGCDTSVIWEGHGLALTHWRDGVETILAYLPTRCNPAHDPNQATERARPSDYDIVTVPSLPERRAHCPFVDGTTGDGCFTYNPTSGSAVVLASVTFMEWFCSAGCEWRLATRGLVCEISGLPTLFEVMQSYAPGPLSFRVPYMPEGFQHADYFDTYYGDLATVGDWNQAQPLQCGYPATPPSVGDYLTVDDTLPTPTSGNGYYYVTAVNYQGQRRYGRQSNGGVLTGRDPAVLPGCD